MNAGPVGLAESMVALGRVLATRPVAVVIQEAHVHNHALPSMRAQLHRYFPSYCVFTSRKPRGSGKIDLITLVHVKMAARAALVNIEEQIATVVGLAPEAAARVHFVRLADPDGQVAVLLGNVHQYDARQSIQQAAVLRLVRSVIDRWGETVQHVIVGGDWNASMHARIGYTAGSVTAAADGSLLEWARETGLINRAPDECTWTDGTRRATLDSFFVRDQSSLRNLCCFSADPRHDHCVVQGIILDDRVGPMPELESLRRPTRLKLEGLKDERVRQEYDRSLETAISRIPAPSDREGVFEHLDNIKAAILTAARRRGHANRFGQTRSKVAGAATVGRVIAGE